MPQRFIEPGLALLLALAFIGGAWGGATAAGLQVLRGKRLGWAFVVAYALVGSTIGLLVYLLGAGGVIVWIPTGAPDAVFGWAVVSALAGTLAIAAKDFGVRFILKRAGYELRAEVYRSPSPDQDEHDPDNDEYRGG